MILESRRRRTPGEGQRREGFVLLDMRLESAHPAKNISASSPNGRGRLSESLCRLEEDGGCPKFVRGFMITRALDQCQLFHSCESTNLCLPPFFESPLSAF